MGTQRHVSDVGNTKVPSATEVRELLRPMWMTPPSDNGVQSRTPCSFFVVQQPIEIVVRSDQLMRKIISFTFLDVTTG